MMSDLPERYPLILNPKAKGEKGRRALKFIMANATRFTIYATRSREEAIDLARKFVREGEELVIAAGGDGTLNAVIEGLAGSQTALGVFPTGTMNVFAREMGIPYDKLENAMEVIDGGHIEEVDLFAMNGAPFVQMAGVGFDAQVIEETTWESKKRLGPFAYLLAASKVLRSKPPQLTVTCSDGRVLQGVAMLVGNCSLYGGQFPLFKNASNTDNLLDAVVFKEAGYQLVKDSLKGLVKGGIDLHSHWDSVEYIQAAGLKVTSKEDVPVEIDGELWGRSTMVDFSQTGKTLKVFKQVEPKVKLRYALLKILSPWRD